MVVASVPLERPVRPPPKAPPKKPKKTVEYSKKIKSSYAQYSVFTPYPGTPVFKEYKNKITSKKIIVITAITEISEYLHLFLKTSKKINVINTQMINNSCSTKKTKNQR